MSFPGSNPDIPETAKLSFKSQWSKRNPGAMHRIAFLPLENGRTLVVFPHREWKDAPMNVETEVVLYPHENFALAAPMGGIYKETTDYRGEALALNDPEDVEEDSKLEHSEVSQP